MISLLNHHHHYRLFSIISAVHILSITTTSALPANLWVVEIDNGPAPSPEEGPPESRGALRDTGYLPIQIGSIIGVYLIWLILTSIAVLTVGRRLRRQAQTPNLQLMEVANPNLDPFPISQPGFDMKETNGSAIWEVTPVSPTKEVPWSLKSWGSMKKHNRSAGGSVVTFNESIISDDRARNEFEMDRLYAAVAEHEAKRQTPGASPPLPQTSPMSPLNQHPPELQHLRFGGKQSYHGSGLLPSPPPEHDLEKLPTSPTSTRSLFKRFQKPPPLNFSDPSRNSSRSSFASFGKRLTPSIRGLPISPPMGSPDIIADRQYLESAPLSPRHYNPGPPPTPPFQYKPNQEPVASPLPVDEDGRRYFFSPTIRSSRISMSSQGYSPGPTPRTATFPIYPPPTVQEEQEQAAQQNHLGSFSIPITIDPSSAAPTPRVVPSTPLPSSQFSSETQQAAPPQNYSVPRIASILPPPPRAGSASTTESSTSRRAAKPAPLSLVPNSQNNNNNSQTTLSLRTAPLPLRALRSPNSTRPMSTIKNTELTRPDIVAVRKVGGLRVPGTAGMVPATPYSPFYMPMTPLTPITPGRLVTREERRKYKKEEGRRALTQDDMVVNEDDLWGEGY